MPSIRTAPAVLLLLLLPSACSEEAPAPPPGPIDGLGPVVEEDIPGLVRRPVIPDGVPRLEHFLPSGARLDLVTIAAVPELEPHPTGFHLDLDADGQPALTALEWGGGPPPPQLGEVPEAGEEDHLRAWKALGEVPEGAVVALWLDERIQLGQAEAVFELLARRGVGTVVFGFSAPR